MKNWIRWWGLGVFVCIGLLWWLLIDVVIKFAIETAGTELNGAKVELASADFQLLGAQLTLHQLQVTNPKLPMENAFAASLIDLEFDSLRLLRRQFIVEQMSVIDLELNTPRASSGAIGGRFFSQQGAFNSDNLKLANTIPGLSLPNTEAMLAEEKQHLQNQVKEISENLQALEGQWQKHIDELPNDDDLKAYKKRWKTLKEKDWMEKLQGIRQLQKDIENDLNTISSLDEQLEKDLLTVQQQIHKAQQLPAKEADRLLAKVGLSNGTQAITEAIMSGQVKQWIKQGSGFITSISGGASASSKPAPPARGKGQWIHFNETQSMPDTLIRHADINGRLSVAGQVINFQGKAQDLSHQPQRWLQPAQFTISGTSPKGGELYAEGIIDHRESANHKIRFSVKDLSVEKIKLSQSNVLSLDMLGGFANIQGDLSIKGNNIDLQTSSQFKQVDLKANSQSSSRANAIIVDALSDIKDFSLSIGLNGTTQNPQLIFNSDMDKLLGGALNNEIKKQSAGLKDKLQKNIATQLKPQLQQLNQQSDYFSSLEKLLSNKQKDIETFSKGVL
mgnify:CR=1 FL=1